VRPTFYTRMEPKALATLKVFYETPSNSGAIRKACEQLASLLLAEGKVREPTQQEIDATTSVRPKEYTSLTIDTDLLKIMEDLEEKDE